MDKNKNINEYKKIAKDYVDSLIELGIPVYEAYIFGSRIKGNEHKWSDLDTCVISSVFGLDTIADRVVLMKMTRFGNNLIEPHPISQIDFASKFNALANEIKSTGVRIL